MESVSIQRLVSPSNAGGKFLLEVGIKTTGTDSLEKFEFVTALTEQGRASSGS